MTTEWRRTTLLVAMLLAVPALATAVRLGRLIGQVLDAEGNPIPGVTVTVTAKELPSFNVVRTTDKKGVFKVDFDHLDVVYRYRFEKTGHRTTEAEQTWSLEGTKSHKFTMQPGGTSLLGSPPPPPASTSNAAILAFNAGVAAFEARDYATAQARFEEALGHDAKLRQAWEVLSAVHLEQTHYREAVEAAEKAIALGATDGALRSRWEAYRKLGDEAKAAEALEVLERLGRVGDEANRIHNQGVSLLKAGDPEGAFAKFRQALEADANHKPALLGVATTGLEINRAAEAAAAAETILAGDPQHEQALRIRYNASLKLGDEVTILDSLVGLARVDPVAAGDRLFKLAQAAFESDDVAKARKRLNQVLDIDPDHPRAHYLLGLILMRAGAKEEAKRHVERFLQLAPDDPDAATAAEILRHLGGT